MRLATTLTLVLLLSAAGCRKSKASPEYIEAKNAFEVVTLKLYDDAYADPEMTRIEALLRKVPSDSADASAAAELLNRIGSERERIAKSDVERQAAIDNALKAPSVTDTPRAPAEPGSVGLPSTVSEAADAGPDLSIAQGLPLATLLGKSRGCFEAGQQITVRDGASEVRAQVYEVSAAYGCVATWGKQYADKVVIVREGKVLAVAPRSALKNEIAPPPEPVPAPVVAQPVDAGAPPEPQQYIPGRPLPDYDAGQ